MPMHAVERWSASQDVAVVSEKRNRPTRTDVQHRECPLEVVRVERKDGHADQLALGISDASAEWDYQTARHTAQDRSPYDQAGIGPLNLGAKVLAVSDAQ